MPYKDEDLLKEVRDEFDYYVNEWASIREEAKKDMRYVAGDPWKPQERLARETAIGGPRPVMAFDELSQFVNQLLNDPKQNPRAIKINPKGSGASDQTARTREGLIREIQYNSRAQAAFTTGFQGAVQRSYGYWRVGSRYRNDGNIIDENEAELSRFMEQELYIGRIPNPDSVLIHPNYKELDASDMAGCFVLNRMRKQDFKRKYPKARITDFTSDFIRLAPQWLQDKEVQVCEYWKVETEQRSLYLVEDRKEKLAMWADELPRNFDKTKVLRERKVDTRKVMQHETNGVEVLGEPVEIKIPWIPIIPCFGEELWVDEGGGSKRKLFSLIRRARDPYMYYCYIRSCQAEMTGLSPKVPWVGVIGQFETHKEQWQMANKQPYAYLQYDLILDSTGRPLPAPQRAALDLPVQGLEMLAEGARRAIQAAMGITPLPTAAQRQNEKSGVALNAIDAQEDRGSFGFIDNYNIALEHTGRVCNAWIPIVYDVPMDAAIREKEENRAIRINDPDFEEPNDQGIPVKTHYDAISGEHGVEVSVGPNFDDQRDEVDNFVNILVQNIETLPLAPDAKAKMLAIAVKIKNLGPLGDELAEIISPDAKQGQQQQAFAAAQQQIQVQQQAITQLQSELQKLQLEKAGKIIQGETQKQLQTMKNDLDLLKALLASKQDIAAQEMEMYKEFWIENHGAAHETAMQAVQHAHDAQQVQAANQQDQQLQQGAQQHDAAMAAQQQQVSQPGAQEPGQQ